MTAYRPDIVYDASDHELCLACGTYDMPDARSRCQYCGARLPSAEIEE